ncbi:preprotein translocase subunit SecE [Aerococcaceae bacterium NML180378]|nr:preprotein translocase subunit SecE [Aerococcaceae bacterium NML180378]
MGYLKRVNKELKRVTWPSFREVTRYTWVVILSIILFGAYFAGIDLGFSQLINWFLSL